jgi:aminoglycoside 6'-N-acetyltransferase I
LIIRAARPSDAAELVRLSNALFPGDAEEEAKAIAQYFEGALDPAVMLVAERMPERLAGYLQAGTRPYAEGCESSPVAYIEAWYVDEDMRRTGVGRALFAAAEDWGRGLGLTEIASDTLIDNEISIAAHRALGYEEVERIVCFRRSL